MKNPALLSVALLLALLATLPASAGESCDAGSLVQPLPATPPEALTPVSLEGVGAPLLGAPFALRVRGGEPEGRGVLFASREASIQVLPGTETILYLPLSARRVPFELDGNGDSPELLRWDAVPSVLCGLEFHAQAAVLDGDAPRSVWVTNAIRTRFGLAAESGGLLPAQSYGVGINPRSVASADLNLDGIPDLAVANSDLPFESGSVSVLLGAGDGTFAAAADHAAGDTPRSLAIVDLNLDGFLDLAVASFSSSDVSILLGAGDGTFAAAESHAAGPNPTSLAVSDLNLDGIPDLVVAKVSSDNVSVLLGAGDGTFGAVASHAAGPQPRAVAVADLNLDGIPDIAATNDYSGALFGNQGYVAVLLGTGDGSFGSHQAHGAGDEPVFTAISDLNLDGIPDLAVANSASKDVSVLLGTGDGDFTLDQNYATGAGPDSVAIADLNLDGVPDLAVTVGFPANVVSVLFGTGAGTFGAAQSHGVGASPKCLVAADLNLDGSPDLAVANLGSNDVSVLLSLLPE